MEEAKEERIEYKIYRIVCNETDEVYFGKTTKTLLERLSEHKKTYNSCTSKQIIERNNYYIEEINSTFDEIESIILERYYIENFECINIQVPGRTKIEYYEDNKDKILKKCKEYRELHKDEKRETDKKYRETHKDELKIKQKEYYETHKDEIKVYKKKWGKSEKRKEKRKETYTCECGSISTIDHKSRHECSQKHIKYINSLK
jgi:hypothetical protein